MGQVAEHAVDVQPDRLAPVGHPGHARAGLPWHVNVTSYHDGVVHGTISHIDIAVSLPACSFTIDGTAGASGIARVTYIDSAHTLKLLPAGGNLHFSNVSGCKHLFHNGDSAAYIATYTITPAQVITSP
jgi:hypothetical protein